MIKTIVGLTLLGATVCALAQGTVTFNNRVPGVVVSPIFDCDGTTGVAGTNWMAQLWAAPGAGAAEFSLMAAFPTTTFRTGAAAGFVVPVTATLTGVAKDAAAATLQLRVWQGDYPTWAAAESASISRQTLIGKSPLFNVFAIGGDLNTPPNLVGLPSFMIFCMPEPSLSALFAMGAALLFSRRRARR